MNRIHTIIGWLALGLISLILLDASGLATSHVKPDDYSKLAISLMRDIDAGFYEKVARNYMEPSWGSNGSEYEFLSWKSQSEIIAQLEDDFGVNGWRLRIVSLDVLDSRDVEVRDIANLHPRLGIALLNLGFLTDSELVHIVVLQGSVTGRCSIDNWIKTIPIVRNKYEYKLVSAGLPEELILIHPGQFLKDIDF